MGKRSKIGSLLDIDISSNSGYNALSRSLIFVLDFIDEFQDRIMFGTDSCRRSDLNTGYKNLAYIKELLDGRRLPSSVLEKMEWKNSARLLGIEKGLFLNHE